MVEEDHYRIFLVITAQQRKRSQHSWQKFPSTKLCRWVTGFQKVYQSEMNWIKDNLQCEILLEKGFPLLPELKLSWIEKRQLMFVLTAVQSERCVCVRAGEQHIWWPCDTTHNQMKENCPISPAAWFKFHFNQIGGRDKCQLVLLPYIDLGGKVLRLITCMLWFSSTPKIFGTPNREKLLVVKSYHCFSSSRFVLLLLPF